MVMVMENETRIVAALYVSGENLQPESVTRAIGLEPTEVRRKGTPARAGPPIRKSEWCLMVSSRGEDSIEDCVCRVVAMVWPVRERLRSIVRKEGLELGVVVSVTIYGERPLYQLSAKTMGRLAELGAGFGLDIYDYS